MMKYCKPQTKNYELDGAGMVQVDKTRLRVQIIILLFIILLYSNIIVYTMCTWRVVPSLRRSEE